MGWGIGFILVSSFLTLGVLAQASSDLAIAQPSPERATAQRPAPAVQSTPPSNDDAISACVGRAPAPQVRVRQLSNEDSDSEKALLKKIKDSALVDLKRLHSQKCAGFEGNLAELSRQLRLANACLSATVTLPGRADLSAWGFNSAGKAEGAPKLTCTKERGGVAAAAEVQMACEQATQSGQIQSFAHVENELRANAERLGSRGNAYLLENFYDRAEKRVRKLNDERKKSCQTQADRLFQQNPLLKHIDTQNAVADLENARGKCAEAARTSAQGISELPIDPTQSQALSLLYLGPLVNQVLHRHPNSCEAYRRMTQRLLDTQASRQTARTVLGLGSLIGCGAATLFATPVIGGACFLATGALSSASHVASSIENRTVARTSRDAEAIGVSPRIAREQDRAANQSAFHAGTDLALASVGAGLTRPAATAAERLLARGAQTSPRSAAELETLAQAHATLAQKALSPAMDDAVLRAHNIGLRTRGGKAEPWTLAEIREKHRILKEAGFSADEIRKLMKNGVVGDAERVAVSEARNFAKTPSYKQWEDDVMSLMDRNLTGHAKSEYELLFDKMSLATTHAEKMTAAQEMKAFRQSVDENRYVPIFERERLAASSRQSETQLAPTTVEETAPFLFQGLTRTSSISRSVDRDISRLPDSILTRFNDMIRRLESGEKLRAHEVAPVKEGIYELRQSGKSSTEYRLYYRIVNGQIRLLGAYQKDQNRIPQPVLRTLLERGRELD